MNLVTECMQVISGHPLIYFRERQGDLLLTLFDRALKNPAVTAYRKDLRQIREYIEAHNDSRLLWRDSEIYHPIEFLARSSEAECFPYVIELLRVLTGMKDIRRAEKRLPDGFYRLKNLCGEVFEIRDGKLLERTRQVLWKPRGFRTDVYLPRSGMFRDLLLESVYPDMADGYDASAVKSRLLKTLDHMKDFSLDLWEDFQEATWNLVLLTDSKVSSMAICYRYFGGVFWNAFRGDEYKGVESLAHEYIHNRCTLWWETDRPTGLPAERVTIVSPVSGNRIMASIMIHAFIIYLNALRFYRHVQAIRMPSDRRLAAALNRRASHLARNMPLLDRRLRRTVRRGTDMNKLLDYLMEVYEPLKKPLSNSRGTRRSENLIVH